MVHDSDEFGPDADDDLPEEVLDAIAIGVTPLGAVRQWKRLSVDELADISGVSAAIINGAEGGRELKQSAIAALAKALGVGQDLFIE